MATSPYLSVVVPVFDEVDCLPAFHAELTAALAALERSAEVVYVDDGSGDGSTELLGKFQLERPELVRVVVLRRNFGKSGALAAGFAAARGELLCTIDADGQEAPSQIGLLLPLVEAGGCDLACGWRRTRADRLTKRLASRWYNLATRTLTGLDLHDFNAGLKVARREVAAELHLYGEFHRFIPVLAHDLGFRVGEAAIVHRPRPAGRSKFRSPQRFPKTLLDLVTVLFLTHFADRPLHLFGGLGAALSIGGFAVLAYLSGLKLLTGAGIGTRPLLSLGVLAMLVGVQMIGIGFIGDVLRHSASRHHLPYRVRELLEAAAAPGAVAPGAVAPTEEPV